MTFFSFVFSADGHMMIETFVEALTNSVESDNDNELNLRESPEFIPYNHKIVKHRL